MLSNNIIVMKSQRLIHHIWYSYAFKQNNYHDITAPNPPYLLTEWKRSFRATSYIWFSPRVYACIG